MRKQETVDFLHSLNICRIRLVRSMFELNQFQATGKTNQNLFLEHRMEMLLRYSRLIRSSISHKLFHSIQMIIYHMIIWMQSIVSYRNYIFSVRQLNNRLNVCMKHRPVSSKKKKKIRLFH